MPFDCAKATLYLAMLTGWLALPACSQILDGDAAYVSTNIEPKHSIVTTTNLDHDIRFAAGSKTLSAAEERSLYAFIRDSAVSHEDDVTVGLPSGGSLKLAAAQQAAVLDALKRLHVAAVPASALPSDNGAVTLKVARYSATPPNCPDWSKPEADEPSNQPASNHGCASESALALMIASPRDLVHGTPGGPADGEALARGVVAYRTGAVSKSLAGQGLSAVGVSGGPSGGGGGQ
jgi:pilus assembly protein CpaD